MKCIHCGGEISLEDKVCPFCGQANESTKTYTDTMDHYEDRLEQATEKVEKTTSLVRNYMVFLVVAIILAILNIVVVTLRAKSEDIKDWLDDKEREKKTPFYIEQIDTAIANSDYILMTEIYLHNNIRFPEDRIGHSPTVHLAIDLENIMDDGMYLTDPLVKDEDYSKEERVDMLAGHIERYIDSYEILDDDYCKEHTTEQDQEQRDQIIDTYRCYMKYYIHLTDEEIDSLGGLSKAQIAMLIGRSLGIYEKE